MPAGRDTTNARREQDDHDLLQRLDQKVDIIAKSQGEIQASLSSTYITRDALSLIVQKMDAANNIRFQKLEDDVADLKAAAARKQERDTFWVRLVVGGLVTTLIPEILFLIYYVAHIRTAQ